MKPGNLRMQGAKSDGITDRKMRDSFDALIIRSVFLLSETNFCIERRKLRRV